MTFKPGQGTPAPKPDIAATISRYKGQIETSRSDITSVETRLGEAKNKLQAASTTISSALESSKRVSASLEGPGAPRLDELGQKRTEAIRKQDAAAIGLVEQVLSGAAGLYEAIGRSIDSLLSRADGLKQSIGVLDSGVGTVTRLPEVAREGYLKDLEPGLSLIERSVASLKRGVDETCASVAEQCDEKTTAMIMAREILAKVPPIPPATN